jgi:sortase A
MKPGDRIVVEMPYGRFVYRVTGHEIVPADDLARLRSEGREQIALQACHPRFSASQRYIVYGVPVSAATTVSTAAAPAGTAAAAAAPGRDG